jgi:hypothetical protein
VIVLHAGIDDLTKAIPAGNARKHRDRLRGDLVATGWESVILPERGPQGPPDAGRSAAMIVGHLVYVRNQRGGYNPEKRPLDMLIVADPIRGSKPAMRSSPRNLHYRFLNCRSAIRPHGAASQQRWPHFRPLWRTAPSIVPTMQDHSPQETYDGIGTRGVGLGSANP